MLAQPGDELTIRRELLKPVVAGIRHVQHGASRGHAVGNTELAVPVAGGAVAAACTPTGDEAAVGIELLDPVVLLVGDIEVSGLIHGHAAR